jgi:hypothetical protein
LSNWGAGSLLCYITTLSNALAMTPNNRPPNGLRMRSIHIEYGIVKSEP